MRWKKYWAPPNTSATFTCRACWWRAPAQHPAARPHRHIGRLARGSKVPGVRAAITGEDFVNHGRFGFPVRGYVHAGVSSACAMSATPSPPSRLRTKPAAGRAGRHHAGTGTVAGRVRPGGRPGAGSPHGGRDAPGTRPICRAATCSTSTSCARASSMRAWRLASDHAGRRLHHHAPGARLHRNRRRGGRTRAGQGKRRDGLCQLPESLPGPRQPGADPRTGSRRCARHPAAGRRRVWRQGRPDVPDVARWPSWPC